MTDSPQVQITKHRFGWLLSLAIGAFVLSTLLGLVMQSYFLAERFLFTGERGRTGVSAVSPYSVGRDDEPFPFRQDMDVPEGAVVTAIHNGRHMMFEVRSESGTEYRVYSPFGGLIGTYAVPPTAQVRPPLTTE